MGLERRRAPVGRRRLLELTTSGLAAGLAGCGGTPEEDEGTNPLEVETVTSEATVTDEATGEQARTGRGTGEAGANATGTPTNGTGNGTLGNGTAAFTDAPGNESGTP